MDRITGRFSNGTAYIKSDGCFGGSIGHFTTQKRLPEIIDKLAEFEDFMEQEEFTSLEDLKAYIKLQSKGSSDLIQENKSLKDMWQKLKEWAGYLCYFELVEKMEELENVGDKGEKV